MATCTCTCTLYALHMCTCTSELPSSASLPLPPSLLPCSAFPPPLPLPLPPPLPLPLLLPFLPSLSFSPSQKQVFFVRRLPLVRTSLLCSPSCPTGSQSQWTMWVWLMASPSNSTGWFTFHTSHPPTLTTHTITTPLPHPHYSYHHFMLHHHCPSPRHCLIFTAYIITIHHTVTCTCTVLVSNRYSITHLLQHFYIIVRRQVPGIYSI